MSQDMILGIIRALLAAAGGGLIANGTVSDSQWQAIVGGVLALVTAVWSVYNKHQHAQAVATALATPVPAPAPAVVQAAGKTP